LPPLLGSYTVEDGTLTFRPRWPIAPGMHIVALFHPPGLLVLAEFDTPKQDAVPSARVEHIYPSTGDIPSNALRMYICFSAAMRRNEAWQHIHLLGENGARLEHALLEVELWDPGATRLTVLFDPARIKRGLAPLKELGPNLAEGQSYTLEIDRDWMDAAGAPLLDGFRKSFRVAAAERTAIEPAKWRVTTPKAGTRDPLVVEFPKPLDYALVLRTLSVAGVKGTAALDRDETEWRFVPDAPWQPGAGRLSIDSALEDVAGNRLYRPFDAVMDQLKKMPDPGPVAVPFRIDEQL
jgi:hypothetical protein